MSTHMLISKSRPLFSITLLACAMTVGACIDDSCGLTSPDEATGSHEEAASKASGRSLIVWLRYDGPSQAASSATVTSTNGGSLKVDKGGSGFMALHNVYVGDSITFRTDLFDRGRPVFITCTYTGKPAKDYLLFDVGVTVDAQPDFDNIAARYFIHCANW